MKRRTFIAAISVVVAIFIIGSGLYFYRSMASISKIFKLNGVLQAEGYYMGEFEFKMLGCAYYLDKGHYITALSRLNELHRQLVTREGLVKVPEFADKKGSIIQELEAMQTAPAAVYKSGVLLTPADEVLENAGELTVIGFDVLQVPRYKISFVRQ